MPFWKNKIIFMFEFSNSYIRMWCCVCCLLLIGAFESASQCAHLTLLFHSDNFIQVLAAIHISSCDLNSHHQTTNLIALLFKLR